MYNPKRGTIDSLLTVSGRSNFANRRLCCLVVFCSKTGEDERIANEHNRRLCVLPMALLLRLPLHGAKNKTRSVGFGNYTLARSASFVSLFVCCCSEFADRQRLRKKNERKNQRAQIPSPNSKFVVVENNKINDFTCYVFA